MELAAQPPAQERAVQQMKEFKVIQTVLETGHEQKWSFCRVRAFLSVVIPLVWSRIIDWEKYILIPTLQKFRREHMYTRGRYDDSDIDSDDDTPSYWNYEDFEHFESDRKLYVRIQKYNHARYLLHQYKVIPNEPVFWEEVFEILMWLYPGLNGQYIISAIAGIVSWHFRFAVPTGKTLNYPTKPNANGIVIRSPPNCTECLALLKWIPRVDGVALHVMGNNEGETIWGSSYDATDHLKVYQNVNKWMNMSNDNLRRMATTRNGTR